MFVQKKKTMWYMIKIQVLAEGCLVVKSTFDNGRPLEDR